MTFNKYYASSVEEARQKARDELGQTYIVMEAQEASNGNPAWVHVLNENSDNGRNKNDMPTYSRRDLFPQVLTKLKEVLYEGIDLFNIDQSGTPINKSESLPNQNKSDAKPAGLTTYNRKQVQNPSVKKKTADAKPVKEKRDFYSALEQETESAEQIKKLTARCDRLEKLVSEQTFGTNLKYISHPAFQQLLTSGVPQSVITTWFNELVNEGLDPYNKENSFIKKLGHKVKKTIDIAADTEPASYILFTGLSGAGKSYLIMKLALHNSFFGNDTCALVSVQPNEENGYSPLSAFAAEQNIKHFTVKNSRQVQDLKDEFLLFDHVLIEMPGLDIQQNEELVKAATMKNAIGDEASVEVHHVINTSVNERKLNSELTRDRQGDDYLDFTHLDHTPQKGRLLPLMQNSNCNIRYVSSGPQIPTSISRFNPAHFAGYLLSNS